MLGLRVNDLVGQEGITKKDLIPFTYPTDEELKRVGVTGIFLGYYIPWEGLHNVLVAKAHGFESWGKVVEGDYDDYENLDNYQAGIHEYFKYLKFGFGRCSDQASMHIRRGRISREEAMKTVKERDGAFRWTYLDKKLEDILEPIGVTVDEFIKICDEFTNKKLFLTDKNGKLIKDKNGNLTKINYDNVEVGAFPDAMDNLRKNGWIEELNRAVLEKETPILGICLGMQLLADKGYEVRECDGLGYIPGEIIRFTQTQEKERIPHVGWNEILKREEAPLFDGIADGTNYYFVHSYHFRVANEKNIATVTPYCGEFVSSVIKDNIVGTQFHPEKSQKAGFKLIKNFLSM